MRLALAQINTSMGAFEANLNRMDRFLREAKGKGADLTIFPELTIVGYPVKDFVEQEGFVERSKEALVQFAQDHQGENFLCGFIDTWSGPGKGRFNAAALVINGKIKFVAHKALLPTYDVFDEARYFDSGTVNEIVEICGYKLGITICEDIWTDENIGGRKLYSRNPAQELKQKGAEIIVNISASPYHEGKEEIRRKLLKNLVEKLNVPFVLVNLVGGNDEVLFDGGSFALNSDGALIAQCKVFEEDLLIVDLKKNEGEIRAWPSRNEAWASCALKMGIHDYVKKCGFKDVVIGLSGGIDSALTAVLATEALGPQNVTGLFMPSPYTSDMSREDAQDLAQKLGIRFLTLPIDSIMKSYEEGLSQVFKGQKKDVTEENIQARIRGNLLMAFSNKFGALVLSTGNKSELAVGYCTQYGDMAGGLAVISDLSKAKVYELARYLNEKWNAIPQRVFSRPPTAELRQNQKDEDSIPPYSVLDPILKLYVEEMRSCEAIVSQGYDKKIVEQVIRMADRNEFKRYQAAPGLKLSPKAFGIGRRMPIARGSA